MPYSAPSTITTGQLVTASLMNTEWAGNIAFLANPPACRVFNNAAIALTSGLLTALTFNSERYDTNTMHDTATNSGRITFNTAGLYTIIGHASFAANGTGYRQLAIRMNGATFLASFNPINNGAGQNTDVLIATTYKFAVADYVELLAQQTSGGALNITSNGNYSPEFLATWVGFG